LEAGGLQSKHRNNKAGTEGSRIASWVHGKVHS